MTSARIGLLALLPVIAMAVYLDGGRYDPSVLKFTPGGAGGGAPLPPSPAGLAMDGRARIYSKENLFEYVNGHAEFFISQGFRSLTVAGYSSPGAPAGKPEFTVDVYDMALPQNAFGALSQESGGMEPVDIGALGFSSGKSMMFIKGSYYVKVDSFGGADKLPELARALDAALPEGAATLPQFAIFPAPGALKLGRAYRREDYLGLDFLRNVFEWEYERDGARFFAFTFTPEEGMAAFNRKAMDTLKGMGVSPVPARFAGLEGTVIEDKYEGAWAMAFGKNRVIGARGFSDSSNLKAFMEEFAGKAGGS